MKKNWLERLRWLLTDRNIYDDDEAIPMGWSNSVLLAFPKLWYFGSRRFACGCTYRMYTGQRILTAWQCHKHSPRWEFAEGDE